MDMDNNVVVPYRDPSVVLRHENSLVVYDKHSHQLALRQAPPIAANLHTLGPRVCPLCDRPIDDVEKPHDNVDASRESHDEEAEFINPEYFRMLGSSLLDASNHISPPESPRKLLRRPGIEDGETTPPATEYRPRPERRPRPVSGHGISSSAFSPKYFEKFFVVERELGKGGKGVVLLVKHVLDGVSLGHFACKRVPVGDDHEWLRKVLLEVQLLQQLSHTNLVSYRHVWLEDVVLTNFGPSVPCAFILQQYCNGGDLHNFVYRTKSNQSVKEQMKERMRRMSRGEPALPGEVGPRRLPFEQIIAFFRDIASGLSYLHSNGFIHRDLKPQNCLLHDTGVPGAELRVLVSDFGEVQMENAVRKSSGATGTISYCAPEVLHQVGPNGAYGNFTQKSDIFSLGMILYFMCFGRLPYRNADTENEENEDLDELRAEISEWKGFEDKYREARNDLPERLYGSLRHLLSTDPNKRPSAVDILMGINTEFGFSEENVPLKRGHMSPKAQSPGIDESNRFFRISPVADSGPGTPNLSPMSSFSRTGKGNLTPPLKKPSSGSQRLVPSKLRERFPSSSGGDAIVRHNSTEDISIKTAEISDGAVQLNTAPDLVDTSSIILRPRKGSKQLIPGAPTPSIHKSSVVLSRWSLWRVPELWLLLKVFIFFGKAVSITSPCAPLAPNPWIYYPLLMLALLDLVGPFLMTTAVLLGLHVGVMLFVNRSNLLCSANPYLNLPGGI